jgi:hypothetical protein
VRRRLSGFGAVAAGAGLGLLIAGCSSGGGATAAKPDHQAAAAATTVAPVPMVSSVQTSKATWATIPMGATAGPNEFWQLFTRTASSSRWTLHTPPDVATNGALVLAGAGATLTAGVRPSIDLTFSPVASTANQGGSWTTSPPHTGLASHPDALAAAADGHLIALGQNDRVSVLAPGGGSWSALTSEQALAAAGPACALTSLTAVAYTPAGTPLAAGDCGRAGAVGIFRQTGSGWRLAGPALPATLAGQPVQVLRLTRTGAGDVALFQAGTGLIAAWSADGSHWTLSGAVKTAGAAPTAVAFGVNDQIAVALAGGRAETIAGPGGGWQTLPALPAGHAVALALPATGSAQALAADGGTLTVWQVTGGRWAKAQTIKVPIQYGSSSGS